MKKYWTMALGLSLMLAACSKNDKSDDNTGSNNNPNNPENPALELKLSTNAPVNFGEELKVEVDDANSSYTYEMTLPANRGTFDQSSYSVAEARFYDHGWYKVSVSDGNGNTVHDSVFATVNPAAFNCSPADNKLTSNLGNVKMTFNSVTHKANGNFGYEVLASSSDGDLRFNFKQKSKPAENMTMISSESNSMAEDEVSVGFTMSGGSIGLVGEPAQPVHITIENGKTVLTLCDFKVTSSMTGTAQISTRVILD